MSGLVRAGYFALDNAIALGSTIGTGLLVWTISREDRITFRRPLVIVDVSKPRPHPPGEAAFYGDPTYVLNIRNTGEAPAINLRIDFSQEIRSASGDPLSKNPVIQDGIAYLGSNQRMSIPLHEYHELQALLYSPVPESQKGAPIVKPYPQLMVTCRYRDLVTRRAYREQYHIPYIPDMYQWTTTEDA